MQIYRILVRSKNGTGNTGKIDDRIVILFGGDYLRDELIQKNNQLNIITAKWVFIWGESCADFEEMIDNIILIDGNLNTVTTSHPDETIDDLANFIGSTVFPNSGLLECEIFSSDESNEIVSMINSLKHVSNIEIEETADPVQKLHDR